MLTYEVPESFPEVETVEQAINDLNSILLANTGRSLCWQSQDSRYIYSAAPFHNEFSSWHIIRISRPDVNREATLDDFRLIAGHPLYATRHTVPFEQIGSGDLQQFVTTLNEESGFQSALEINRTELTDYALVDNALFDLARMHN